MIVSLCKQKLCPLRLLHLLFHFPWQFTETQHHHLHQSRRLSRVRISWNSLHGSHGSGNKSHGVLPYAPAVCADQSRDFLLVAAAEEHHTESGA